MPPSRPITASAHHTAPSREEIVEESESEVDATGSEFSKEIKHAFVDMYRRRGSLEDRRAWIVANEGLTCDRCVEKNIPCVPGRDIPCCEACKEGKANGRCTRAMAEKKMRIMRAMGLDDSQYDKLLHWYEVWRSMEDADNLPVDLETKKPERKQVEHLSRTIQRQCKEVEDRGLSKQAVQPGIGTSSRRPLAPSPPPSTGKGKAFVKPKPRTSKKIAESSREVLEDKGTERPNKFRIETKKPGSASPRKADKSPQPVKKPTPTGGGNATRTAQPVRLMKLVPFTSDSEDDKRSEAEPENKQSREEVQEEEAEVEQEIIELEGPPMIPSPPKFEATKVESRNSDKDVFYKLHVLKKQLENAMKDVERTSPLWRKLNIVAGEINKLADSHIDLYEEDLNGPSYSDEFDPGPSSPPRKKLRTDAGGIPRSSIGSKVSGRNR